MIGAGCDFRLVGKLICHAEKLDRLAGPTKRVIGNHMDQPMIVTKSNKVIRVVERIDIVPTVLGNCLWIADQQIRFAEGNENVFVRNARRLTCSL